MHYVCCETVKVSFMFSPILPFIYPSPVPALSVTHPQNVCDTLSTTPRPGDTAGLPVWGGMAEIMTPPGHPCQGHESMEQTVTSPAWKCQASQSDLEADAGESGVFMDETARRREGRRRPDPASSRRMEGARGGAWDSANPCFPCTGHPALPSAQPPE